VGGCELWVWVLHGDYDGGVAALAYSLSQDLLVSGVCVRKYESWCVWVVVHVCTGVGVSVSATWGLRWWRCNGADLHSVSESESSCISCVGGGGGGGWGGGGGGGEAWVWVWVGVIAPWGIGWECHGAALQSVAESCCVRCVKVGVSVRITCLFW